MTVPTGSDLLSALLTGVLLGGILAGAPRRVSCVFGVTRWVHIVVVGVFLLGAYVALN
jgi:hypothetical protein